jgi:hypothetical protein
VSTITVNDLRPGMVLNSDAVHSNGRVLLRGGAVLEDIHIKTFKSWGLVSVEIEGITQEQVESVALNDLNPSIIAAVRDELSYQFRHADITHPVIGELHRLLLRLRARQKNSDSGNEMDN